MCCTIRINPLSSPLVSNRNTKESFPNPRVCHLTYWMRHFACNTLNTTVFHILLLTLCASLEYICLNPGIFTVLPIIRFMACSLALYAECMKTAVFKRRDEKYILLTAPFPLRSHIIDLLMVCFHVDLHSVPLALSLGVATLCSRYQRIDAYTHFNITNPLSSLLFSNRSTKESLPNLTCVT